MCRRQRPHIARCESFFTHRFPRRRRSRRRFDGRIDGDTCGQFDGQRLVRLLDFDPGEAIAKKILTLAPVPGLRNDLQRREMHALAITVNRRQAQHVIGVRHR